MDNNFKLAESVAIFRYLARRNEIDDHWYPKDDQARARIDEYLEWQHLNTRQVCFQYFMLAYLKPRKLGPSPDDAQVNASAMRQMDETLDKIEKIWLKDGPFIGGRKEISFADILAACEIEQPSEHFHRVKFIFILSFMPIFSHKIGLAGYEPGHGRPKLNAWHHLVRESTNPVYDEAHAIAYKLAARE